MAWRKRPRKVMERERSSGDGAAGEVRRGWCSGDVNESNGGTNTTATEAKAPMQDAPWTTGERKALSRRRMLRQGRRAAEVALSKLARKRNPFENCEEEEDFRMVKFLTYVRQYNLGSVIKFYFIAI
ncbi:hypothetical protein VIGAN_07165000 [Vigna angularis var. angularis]|uniref:Uncharacterized protein n=1 Tax=Vigna angularis var. angularis TaxID=157739 RepID=A0A0S3SJ45_PHAAN|nr:hypothetical protein VIGAN_07165000 [Vigna angularis var. angularis]